jgi:hypothetical protein
MLAVMADEKVHPLRRDRMAVAAAPYVHARVDASPLGKKRAADLAALDIHKGTSWEAVLERHRPKPVQRSGPNWDGQWPARKADEPEYEYPTPPDDE